MPRTYESLSLEDAKRMLSAAEKKATGFGVAYNIAVVDAGANLVAFVLSLATQDKIRHTTNLFKFEQINEFLDRIRAGEIVGRAVMKW